MEKREVEDRIIAIIAALVVMFFVFKYMPRIIYEKFYEKYVIETIQEQRGQHAVYQDQADKRRQGSP